MNLRNEKSPMNLRNEKSDVLRLGICGLGMAAGRVIPEIAGLPFIRLTGATDIRPQAVEAFEREFGGKGFANIEELTQSPDVDAIYVATPHEYHAEHTITALNNKKHVIVEKPMAVTLDECEAMNAAAEANGVILMCGHTHSFDSPIQKMAQIVESGEIGRPLMINASYYKNYIYRPFSDHNMGMCRGIVLDQGPHQVDIARLLGGGMVRSVRAVAVVGEPNRGEPPERPAEGNYVCFLEFENGLPASLTFSGYARFDTAELVWGIGEGGGIVDPGAFIEAHRFFDEIGSGAIRAANFEELLESWRYGGKNSGEWFSSGAVDESRTHQPFFGLNIVTCDKGDVRQSPDGLFLYTNQGRREVDIPHSVHGRVAEMTELYEAVVERRQVAHSGRWGEATLEVCLAILESSATHKEILMTHQVSTSSQPMALHE